MLEELWLIPLGFVAGILGSIICFGGGTIIVPVLTFVGFSPTLAVGNSLFAAFSNSVASTAMYAKQKRIEFSLGLKLGLMAVPGTILGAIISSDISPETPFSLHATTSTVVLHGGTSFSIATTFAFSSNQITSKLNCMFTST